MNLIYFDNNLKYSFKFLFYLTDKSKNMDFN